MFIIVQNLKLFLAAVTQLLLHQLRSFCEANLDEFVRYCTIFESCWTILDHLELFWTFLDKFGPF